MNGAVTDLDSADVHSAFVKLEGRGNPTPTTALNPRPVEVT